MMLNILYEHKNEELMYQFISPYFGVGIGPLSVEDADNVAFGYQLMAGLNFAAYKEIDLFAGYRYIGSSDIEASGDVGLLSSDCGLWIARSAIRNPHSPVGSCLRFRALAAHGKHGASQGEVGGGGVLAALRSSRPYGCECSAIGLAGLHI